MVVGGYNTQRHLTDIQMISITVEGVKNIKRAASTPYSVGFILDSTVISPDKESVFVIGGWYHINGRSEYDHVLMYDISSGRWRGDPLPSLITGRYQASSFILNQTIYTVGGYIPDKGRLSSMECLRPV